MTSTPPVLDAGTRGWMLRTGALGVAGVVLVLAALAAYVGLSLRTLDGYPWPDEAAVPVDGQSHLVDLGSPGRAMVWDDESIVSPTCRVTDPASDEQLEVRTTDSSHRREFGTAGDWVGRWTFEAPSATVEVTCDRPSTRQYTDVMVEPAPRTPPFLASLGQWAALPAALGVAGLLALVAAVVLALLRRPSRRVRPGGDRPMR
ncbi:hypothetical protein [Nocardioides sp. SYSU DS0663]|uniref:hypothetical protein n=1 Tax=Nocardioides sp. SYSU DS0663 TaxID=3416445 RepID=UPI003F4B970E